jgi:predicted ferric reductase
VTLFVRASVWFGLYVALTLLPLLVAWWERPWEAPRPALVEASVATGLLALPLMVFQFALVSRLGPASRPFGSDALMQFHGQMGIIALVAVIAHPLLLVSQGLTPAAWNPLGGPWLLQSGALAFWATVLIVVTSVFRRRLGLGYEVWQGLHLLLAVGLTAAMVAHILAARGYAAEPGMRVLLGAYGGIAALSLLQYRLLRPLVHWRRPWTLVENRDVGGSTRLLRVRPDGHAGFAFECGQFAWVITGSNPLWSAQHPISMASSAVRPEDGTIEFGIKALGDWSGTVVPALQPGARLWIDGAFGAFTPEGRPAQGYVLVAGGIGISPMRSILLTLRDQGDLRPILLFYAAHSWPRVAFRDEVAALEAELNNLTVVYVFEDPDARWTGERGFVTAELLRRHVPRQYRRFQFFVCGPPGMMDALEKALIEIGVPASAVQTERFDMV